MHKKHVSLDYIVVESYGSSILLNESRASSLRLLFTILCYLIPEFVVNNMDKMNNHKPRVCRSGARKQNGSTFHSVFHFVVFRSRTQIASTWSLCCRLFFQYSTCQSKAMHCWWNRWSMWNVDIWLHTLQQWTQQTFNGLHEEMPTFIESSWISEI